MAEDPFADVAMASKAEDPFADVAMADGSEESEGFIQEIVEGVGSGLTKIPQGILELGATGIDLVAGTETADPVRCAWGCRCQGIKRNNKST